MTTALLTDHYELTMVQAAMDAGTAGRRSLFDMFTRRLPEGRRYGTPVLARPSSVRSASEVAAARAR